VSLVVADDLPAAGAYTIAHAAEHALVQAVLKPTEATVHVSPHRAAHHELAAPPT
jgi:divalent metal cation (Fe/Co/Zn/Cd) transporter